MKGPRIEPKSHLPVGLRFTSREGDAKLNLTLGLRHLACLLVVLHEGLDDLSCRVLRRAWDPPLNSDEISPSHLPWLDTEHAAVSGLLQSIAGRLSSPTFLTALAFIGCGKEVRVTRVQRCLFPCCCSALLRIWMRNLVPGSSSDESMASTVA